MDEGRFVFLMAPKNSGTTIMSQYLAQQIDGYLPPYGNNEGQSAPSLRRMMRRGRWRADVDFDWSVIRREWTRLLSASGKSVFVEASPPNLMRAEAIEAEFGDAARFVVSISSPYAHVASCVFNYRTPPATPDLLRKIAANWLDKAHRLDDLRRRRDAPFVGYADFCADPRALNRALGAPVRPVAPLPGKRTSGRSEIVDMTPLNLSFLTEAELDAVGEALSGEEALLARFGLELKPGRALLDAAAAHPALAAEGRARRRGWENGEARIVERRARMAAREEGRAPSA